MGSPLCSVITNFFIEDLKEMALNWDAQKTLCWFCYMDDSFCHLATQTRQAEGLT
jgi:hypothetical protein